MKYIHCTTCGWARQHDERESEPGRWLLMPADGIAFHHLREPSHLVGFDDLPGLAAQKRIASGGGVVLVMAESEYEVGRAYRLGFERGQVLGKRRALEAVERS